MHFMNSQQTHYGQKVTLKASVYLIVARLYIIVDCY